LKLQGISFLRQLPLPVEYKGLRLDYGCRVDILVDQQIILELKSVEHLLGIHEAQLLTYMKLAGIRHGFLINFNVKRLKDGRRSFIL
jgi:GxxExxY protein